MRSTVHLGLLALVLLCTITTPALGQDDVGYRGWGPRLGLTIDPDQFHFGAHFDIGAARKVRFQPNLEVGLGSDLVLFCLNAEAAYRFSSNWDSWSPYLGGGIGVNIASDDDDGVTDESDTEFGVNALFGVERGLSSGDRFFVESKFGLVDSPDVKITAGWTFFH